MRKTLAIAHREIHSFFVSPIAYFVIAGFGLLASYFFLNLLAVFNIVLNRIQMSPWPSQQIPNLNQGVIEGYYATLLIILVFLIPLLTMRIIAEERKRGTFELLATSPLSVADVVIGKFLGLAFVILVMMLVAGIFPLILCFYGNPEVGPVISGWLALLLCALGFASVGMAVSSFTENQIVAGITSMVTLLLLYVVSAPAETIGGLGSVILTSLSPIEQSRELLNGVITLKSLVYFASLISFGLFLSLRSLELQRGR